MGTITECIAFSAIRNREVQTQQNILCLCKEDTPTFFVPSSYLIQNDPLGQNTHQQHKQKTFVDDFDRYSLNFILCRLQVHCKSCMSIIPEPAGRMRHHGSEWHTIGSHMCPSDSPDVRKTTVPGGLSVTGDAGKCHTPGKRVNLPPRDGCEASENADRARYFVALMISAGERS